MHSKLQVLAAKTEATLGTAIALSATDAAFFVRNLTITPEADESPRMYQGTASPMPDEVGARKINFSFEVECHGKGSAGVPTWAETFLTACGFYLDTQTYKLVTAEPAASGDVPRTITIGAYQDGRLFTAAGCMGNVVFVLTNGKIGLCRFEFQGKLVSNTDTALIAPTLPAVTPPRASNMTMTYASVVPRVAQIEIDMGNEVYLRPDASDGAGESGYAFATITNRRPIITWAPEAVLVADHDIYGKWLSGTLGAFSAVLGATANNIMTFAAPSAQVTSPSPTDANGLIADQMTLLLTRSAANDDEFTLAFS